MKKDSYKGGFLKEFPNIYATNIAWDIDENNIADAIIENNLTEKILGFTKEEIVSNARKYDKDISEEDAIYDSVLDTVHHNRISSGTMEELGFPPDTIEIPVEIWSELDDYDYTKVISDDFDYVEAISNYISDESGFCHEGFTIECNFSIEELYELKNKNKDNLSKEYESPNADFLYASSLEDSISLINEIIKIMGAEKNRDLNKVPLEH